MTKTHIKSLKIMNSSKTEADKVNHYNLLEKFDNQE